MKTLFEEKQHCSYILTYSKYPCQILKIICTTLIVNHVDVWLPHKLSVKENYGTMFLCAIWYLPKVFHLKSKKKCYKDEKCILYSNIEQKLVVQAKGITKSWCCIWIEKVLCYELLIEKQIIYSDYCS